MEYDALFLKIHDSCALIYFGVRIIRRNKPKKNWSRKLSPEGKEVFKDYSFTLHEIPKPQPKRKASDQNYSPTDIELNLRPFQKFRTNHPLSEKANIVSKYASLDSSTEK